MSSFFLTSNFAIHILYERKLCKKQKKKETSILQVIDLIVFIDLFISRQIIKSKKNEL